MEPIQSMDAFSYGDQWDPINFLFTNEDLELTQMLLGQAPPGLDIPVDSFFMSPEAHIAMPGMLEGLLNPEPAPNCDSLMVSSSQEGSYATGFDGYYCPAGMSLSMEEKYNSGESFVPDFTGQLLGGVSLGVENDNNAAGIGDDVLVEQEVPMKSLQPKRKHLRKNLCATQDEDAETDLPENSKKRKPRASKSDIKGKKNARPMKKQKLAKPNDEDGEESNFKARQEGSGPCCSEEADSVSQDNGVTTQNSDEVSVLNSDGKTTRASRGTATDPQSLYARRRRERINERLKILQNLVPNGTKVDISTMLEEAVHYVKFLQLQIKLLSSDDMWMYAPIAYNGMDIGLNQILPSHDHLS